MDRALPDTKPFASFEWMLAARYLRARRKEGFISVISLFSFLGILLGVATLIVVMAVLNGFRAELLDKVLGFNGHISVYSSGLTPISNYRDIEVRLAKVPGVTRVTALVEGQAFVTSSRNGTGALVRGISEADFKRLPSITNKDLTTALVDPGVPDAVPSLDGFDKAGGVAIGQGLADRHLLGLGSSITILSPDGPDTVVGTVPQSKTYKVVAIFKVGMSDYDSGVVYMPMAEAQDLFSVGDGASQIELFVDNPDDVDAYVAPVQEAAGPDMQVQTWKARNLAFFTALAVERNVMFLVLTMIILVAALNIISGLIMLVKDKGHDIAILRTMGATRGAVQRVFFLTGAVIGVAGTLGGLVVGLLICLNVERIRQFVQYLSGVDPFNPELYYLAQLPARLDSWQTFLIVLMSLALSFLATLYPSWRAARLDPVEALRYE
ncbi:MAG: lipoprotein-releasing ABC transporter permease subunit [Rhizobiales bacterium]|nr:lipoprotein-releasing ABC transporter permease subunit [Hyphomicrobiales bacterium]MBI3674479.1 lipoprotein-releasing ABC transporter permease subunit [Hyphomicrobiales bacterium]